ncbi:MAG TPA: hypothetical protein VLR94_06590, partial [Acidobacteriota bacterium]|nr:hypothetical protein [Acidobacteriota bacterium]
MPRFLRNLVLVLLVLFLAGAGLVFLAPKYYKPRLRDQMVFFLEKRFNAEAHLDDVTISLYPEIHITGGRLALRYRGAEELPPLISVDQFSADAPLSALFERQVEITGLSLVNLQITIPPDRSKPGNLAQAAPNRAESGSGQRSAGEVDFQVDRIVADGATLTILPKNPDKDPLIFELRKLSVYSLARDQPLGFVTLLRNAMPPGWIDSRGQFGPWNSVDPGRTPVRGEYVFRDADLSVFKGISGKLASTGKYHGVLQRIEVNGTTDTPDFAVRTGKHPMHLAVEFSSVVDGTNGDTLLQPVRAVLGDRTLFVCSGGVYKKNGQKGKTVELDVNMEHGRIEDLLQLVVPGEPALAGLIQFRSQFELPPG